MNPTMLRAAWATLREDDRQEAVELARQGEDLMVSMGGARPNPSAQQLPAADTNADQAVRWAEQYAPEAERVTAMNLATLMAGVSPLDPRSDQVVMRLAARDARPWPAILVTLRERQATPAIMALADWWSARATGLVTGNESQQAQARIHRAWWDWLSTAAQLPRQGASPAVPPIARPPSSDGGGGGGLFLLVALALGAKAFGKRRR